MPPFVTSVLHIWITTNVCHPQGTRGGHSRLRVRGWGSPNSDDWRKSFALCLLCARVALQGGEYFLKQYWRSFFYVKNVSVCLPTINKTKANFIVFCSDCLYQLESSGFPVGYWRTRAGIQLPSEEHGHVLGNRLQRHLADKFLWSSYTAARCPTIDVWPCNLFQ